MSNVASYYAKKECLHVSGRSCQYLTGCDFSQTTITIEKMKACDGETMETFDVSNWTPEQFDLLREFIRSQDHGHALNLALSKAQELMQRNGCDSSIASFALSKVSDRHLLQFYALQCIFGKNGLYKFFDRQSVWRNRRTLEQLGVVCSHKTSNADVSTLLRVRDRSILQFYAVHLVFGPSAVNQLYSYGSIWFHSKELRNLGFLPASAYPGRRQAGGVGPRLAGAPSSAARRLRRAGAAQDEARPSRPGRW